MKYAQRFGWQCDCLGIENDNWIEIPIVTKNSESLQKFNIKKIYENSKFNKFITKPLKLKYFHKTAKFSLKITFLTHFL